MKAARLRKSLRRRLRGVQMRAAEHWHTHRSSAAVLKVVKFILAAEEAMQEIDRNWRAYRAKRTDRLLARRGRRRATLAAKRRAKAGEKP